MWSGLRRTWRSWVIETLGAAVLVVGVISAVSTDRAAGAVAVVAAGGVLLLMPSIGGMLDEISFGSRGLTLKLSRDAAKAGAPEAARTLEQSGLADFATAYAFVHEELTDDRFHGARVHLQDVLVDKARALATRQKLQPDEVRRLFRNGSPILRVLSLGLMKGDPSLADASLISAAIVEPRSRNEQYHGLDLARLMWPLLSTSERAFIKTHIEGARVPPDSDRHRLAQDILLRQTE